MQVGLATRLEVMVGSSSSGYPLVITEASYPGSPATRGWLLDCSVLAAGNWVAAASGEGPFSALAWVAAAAVQREQLPEVVAAAAVWVASSP